MLRAYMHGFFMDAKLYREAKAIANPFEYDEYRKEQIEKLLDDGVCVLPYRDPMFCGAHVLQCRPLFKAPLSGRFHCTMVLSRKAFNRVSVVLGRVPCLNRFKKAGMDPHVPVCVWQHL